MILALLILLAPADLPLSPGVYRFETDERVNGRAVCTERWELRADGTMTVQSGEEVVEARYRQVADRDGDWLMSTSLSTNHQPDCMGRVTRGLSGEESRTYLVAFNSGSIATCPPPTHTPDGAPFVSGCFGSLRREDGQ